jgi:hypothetical protein
VTEQSAQGFLLFISQNHTFIAGLKVEGIMKVDELEVVGLELKYCERCGALWLRPCGSEQAYCAICIPKMLESPAIRKSKAARRLPVADDLCCMELDEASVCTVEGGHA